MKPPVFTGSSVAVVTPFRDGSVDFYSLGRLIDMQISAGTSAITVCGTTGESSTLTTEEQFATIAFAVKHAAGRVKIIAGTGSNDTAKALHLSRAAKEAGADALLIVTPYYNKTTQTGLIKHFTYLADNVSLPIILYNVPSRTGLSFTADTYASLAAHPNINGVKEASGDMRLFTDSLCKCGNELHFWSGNDDEVVPMMSLGAKGVISVAANIIPHVMASMTDACFRNNYELASLFQLEYMPLIRALFLEVNPIPVKAALELMGLCYGGVRLPLCRISDSNLEILKKEMRRAGLYEQ